MNKIWKYIVGAFAFLLGMFLYERNKREDAEAKLENADAKKQDAVLGQHTEDLKNELNKDVADANAEKAKTPTEQELLDFLNKNKV